MRTYVGFVRDHSGSMRTLANGAMNDYNLLIEGVRGSASAIHDIYATVVECGVGYLGNVVIKEVNKPIAKVDRMTRYVADGSRTPLWESIKVAVNQLKSAQHNYQIYGENVAFLVEVITDGQNNVNNVSSDEIARLIRELQASDVWTFVFRVPKGYKKEIVRLGIPEANVMEWEQTNDDLVRSSEATVSATRSYFDSRSKGLTSTTKFYTDLKDVSITEVKAEMKDVTNEVHAEPVWSGDDGIAIKDFCDKTFGEYVIGCGYYQLSKTEKIQPQKKLIIKHKKSGKYYAGAYAREVLGLPNYELRVHPGDHHQYEIYVQSTSVNRKLPSNTKVVYWKGN